MLPKKQCCFPIFWDKYVTNNEETCKKLLDTEETERVDSGVFIIGMLAVWLTAC